MRQRGQSEGTGARRDTAEDRKSKREKEEEKEKKTEKESEKGETEQNTNDHMKRTSHEERESDTESNSTLLQPSISTIKCSNAARVIQRQLSLMSQPLFHLFISFFQFLLHQFILMIQFAAPIRFFCRLSF